MIDGPTNDPECPRPSEPAPEEDSLSRLLHFTGPRQDYPGVAMQRLESAARPAWQESVRAHAAARRRRTWLTLAAASVAVLVAGLLLRLVLPGTVATVETLAGGAGEVSDARGTALRVGDGVTAGGEIRTTGNARAALRLATGSSVRLDSGTHLTARSATVLELHQGAVYVDTGPLPAAGSSITVHTPHGTARDLGTQFEVRLAEKTLRVRVREGEVEVRADGALHPALAGDVLTVRIDGSVERDTITRHGPEWDWAAITAPPFVLEGRKIRQFLDWVCREKGLELSFPDRVAERRAASATGHGSLEGLRPEQALDVVLPGAGLAFRIDGGRLTVTSSVP